MTSKTDSSYSFSFPSEIMAPEDLVGSYKCSWYIGTSGENPWHHVTIKAVAGTGKQVFRWKNHAGVTWALTYNPEQDELLVGGGCPYFKNGHTRCKVERDGQGQIVALLGPWGERYDKQLDEPVTMPSSIEKAAENPGTKSMESDGLVGRYQATAVRIGTAEENPWHHVTVEAEPNGSTGRGKKVFRWSNRAGVSWTLTHDPNDPNDPDSLVVGTECPHFRHGHMRCQIKRDNQGQILALVGPWGQLYDRCGEPIQTATPSDGRAHKSECNSGTKRRAMKDAVLREKAELLKMKNEEMRKKQEEEATGKDCVEEAKKMRALTGHLAAVAHNIQAIAALKEVLSKDKAYKVDRLTGQLLDDMQALVQSANGTRVKAAEEQPAAHTESMAEEEDFVAVN